MKPYHFGTFGTIAAITLHQWSEIASIGAAVSTIIYMAVCTYKKLKK
jgi:hypothetical protein